MKPANQKGKKPVVNEELLFDGLTTRDITSANLSPAEQGFFKAFRTSNTNDKKTWLVSIQQVLANFLPKTAAEQQQQLQEEQKTLEAAMQSNIIQILRTATQRYFYEEVKREAAKEATTFDDKTNIGKQLEDCFAIHHLKSSVSVVLTPEKNDQLTLKLDDDGYEHSIGHRVSAELETAIANAKPEELSDKAKTIANKALANVRGKMDVVDDALNELGGEAAREKLAMMLGRNGPSKGAPPEMVFYVGWQSGKTCHADPVFKNTGQADTFAEVIGDALKSHFADYTVRPSALADDNIDIVTKRLVKRIVAHDQQLERQSKQPSGAKIPAASAPVAAAAVKAAAAHKPAAPADFTLERASSDMMRQLAEFAYHEAAAANGKTERLMSAVNGVAHDERLAGDDKLKSLASLLLSSGNIMATAKALDADAPIKNHKFIPPDTLQKNAQRIQALYKESPTVRAFVDDILKDERGLLFATLTLNRDQSHQVIESYVANDTALGIAKGKIDERLEKIATRGTTEEALLRDAPDDHDAQKLVRDRSAVAALEQRSHAILGTLEDAVRQTMSGKRAREITIREVPLTVTVTNQHVPAGWNNEHAKFHRFDADPEDPKNRHFILSSKDYPGEPRLTRRLDYNAPGVKISAAIQSLREECEYHRCNQPLIAELSAQPGFERARVEGQDVLRHSALGIFVPLDQPAETLDHQLRAARDKFSEHTLDQDTVPHMRQDASNAKTQNYPAYNCKPATRETFAWQPKPDETLVVFDSCTLKRLCARRGGSESTWLDLVKATSKLPNVRVVIPEVMVWETEGKIPTFDGEGRRNGTKLITHGFDTAHLVTHPEGTVLHHDAAAVHSLLEDASYGRLQADGNVLMSEGKNPNIIVMSTPGDRDLYGRIQKAVRHGALNEVYGQGEGEKAIERFLGGIKLKVPVVVVSDDLNYLRPASVARRTTGGGSSVSYTGGLDYVMAECGNDRRATLSKELGISTKLSAQVIDSDEAEHARQFRRMHSPLLSFKSPAIVDPHTGKVHCIGRVVADGAVLQAQGVSKNGNAGTEIPGNWLQVIEASRAAGASGSDLPPR